METKQYFNELPRPTFRWLGVNHTEGVVTEKATGVASALTWEGDVEVVVPLQDKALLKDSYTGANRDSLDAVVEKAGRAGEHMVISDLENFTKEEIDMQTLVIIGNSQTYVEDGRMITPRGYKL